MYLLAFGLAFCCCFFLVPFSPHAAGKPSSLSVGGAYSSAWLTRSEQSAIDRMLKTDTLINFRSQCSLTKMAHKLPQGSGAKIGNWRRGAFEAEGLLVLSQLSPSDVAGTEGQLVRGICRTLPPACVPSPVLSTAQRRLVVMCFPCQLRHSSVASGELNSSCWDLRESPSSGASANEMTVQLDPQCSPLGIKLQSLPK